MRTDAIIDLRHARTSLLDIAYFDHGRPDDFPVVLLHGWPDDALTWERVSAPLTEAGFRVIVPYLRGFGPTRFLSAETRRSGQLAALGQDLVEFVHALRLEHFALVGHDWGARAAAIATTELQATGCVTHLVMLSVGYGTNDPDQKLPLRQIQNYWYHWYMSLPRGLDLVRDDRKAFTRYIWDIWAPSCKLTPEEFDATAASFDNPDWFEIVINSYRHRWGYAAGDPRYEALEKRLNPAPRVQVPTLVLHGADDPCNHPMTSEGKEPFFTKRYGRKLLPGVGHFPQREAASAVAGELVSFLRANEPKIGVRGT